MNLAEIDDLVAALQSVQSRTDAFEADLALAVTLVGEGEAIGPVLQSIGADCFRAGNGIRVRAGRLSALRLPHATFSSRRGPRHRRVVGSGARRPSSHPLALWPPQRNSQRSALEDSELYGLLVGLGLSPEESRAAARSFEGRESWEELRDLDVDLTDPEAFGAFPPALFALAFDDLLAASKDLRLKIDGPNQRPMPGRNTSQRGLHHGRDLISEDDLIRIAEHPDETGPLAAIAALIVADRAYLAALDGAGQRRGDVLGGQAIDAEDGLFSIDDVTKLNSQRLIARSLGPVADQIDGIGGGGLDGIRSKHDYKKFADSVREENPELAARADLVVEAGLFDLGGWDKTADWASNAGLALGVAAMTVTVVGTGGAALPAVIAALSATAAGTEFVAGIKTNDAGHIVGGGLGAFAGATTVIRSIRGLGAGIVSASSGLDDATVNGMENINDFTAVLKAGDAMPTRSLSEIEKLAAPFNLTTTDWYRTFGNGVRAAPGSLGKLAPRIEDYAIANLPRRYVTNTWTVDQLPRLTAIRKAHDVADTAIENGAGPLSGLVASKVVEAGRRRREDNADDDGRTRPAVPEPSPTTPKAEQPASHPSVVPAPNRTPVPVRQPVVEPVSVVGTPLEPIPKPAPTPVPAGS